MRKMTLVRQVSGPVLSRLFCSLFFIFRAPLRSALKVLSPKWVLVLVLYITSPRRRFPDYLWPPASITARRGKIPVSHERGVHARGNHVTCRGRGRQTDIALASEMHPQIHRSACQY